ncbi:MAG: hypothetical protein FWF35_04140 [Elusimicrobia bacterium]|nr:hypothetical protein [Elusimicrobiota bacterium]
MANLNPKLRTVQKVKPPFDLNEFPKGFISNLGRELAYAMATKLSYDLQGSEWEEIFANCVGAKWKPSNVGLDDVVLGNCCWGAKTVKSASIRTQKRVRLISGRNSPKYSFGDSHYLSADPNSLGEQVLAIWNERVSAVRKEYKFVRTVVLMKGKNFDEFAIFEFDTQRYEHELYTWKWNSRENLEGFDAKGKHCFTWQPHGSQFTIVEDIPSDTLYISITKPPLLKKEDVLSAMKYKDSWVKILK